MGEFSLTEKELADRMTLEQRLAGVGKPGGLSPQQGKAIARARLQYAMSELADMNVVNVHNWLQEVARVNPAEAIRLFMELADYTTPRLKAAQVNANLNVDATPGGGKNLKEMTLDELQSIVSDQGGA